MAVTYKDIDQLTQKASPTGAEKLPVSDTEYITPQQIAGMVEVEDFLSKSSTRPLENGIATRSFIEAMPIDPTSEVTSRYMRVDGTQSSEYSNYAYRTFPVTPGETYAVTTMFGTGFSVGIMRAAIWLDGNGNVLSYSEEGNGSAVAQYHDYLYTAPTGAASLVVNFRSTYMRAGTVKKVAPPHPACVLNTAQSLTSTEKQQARTNIGVPNITISSSEPTASDGNDGDIWIVV